MRKRLERTFLACDYPSVPIDIYRIRHTEHIAEYTGSKASERIGYRLAVVRAEAGDSASPENHGEVLLAGTDKYHLPEA